jgi:TetR/AcrR family transcriptional repressor of lmrAB and yxaGH operons
MCNLKASQRMSLRIITYRVIGTTPNVTKIRLIEATIGVLINKGYKATSLRNIAALCKIKEPSIYHHFPQGKQQIVKTALDVVSNTCEQYVFHILQDKSKTAQQRFDAFCKALKRLMMEKNLLGLVPVLATQTSDEESFLKKPLADYVLAWEKAIDKLLALFHVDAKRRRVMAATSVQILHGSWLSMRIMQDKQALITAHQFLTSQWRTLCQLDSKE